MIPSYYFRFFLDSLFLIAYPRSFENSFRLLLIIYYSIFIQIIAIETIFAPSSKIKKLVPDLSSLVTFLVSSLSINILTFRMHVAIDDWVIFELTKMYVSESFDWTWLSGQLVDVGVLRIVTEFIISNQTLQLTGLLFFERHFLVTSISFHFFIYEFRLNSRAQLCAIFRLNIDKRTSRFLPNIFLVSSWKIRNYSTQFVLKKFKFLVNDSVLIVRWRFLNFLLFTRCILSSSPRNIPCMIVVSLITHHQT